MARVAFDQQLASRDPALAFTAGEGEEVSDLLAAVKARVAEDKRRHWTDPSYGDQCDCGSWWPCDAARYLSFAEAQLEWIEDVMQACLVKHDPDYCLRDEAESELASLAKLLGVQG